MEKEKRITSYVSDFKGLVIYGNLDEKEYAVSWLAFCNNKRDNKEFVELMNFSGTNKIRIVIDITDDENEIEATEHYIEFFESWNLEIINVRVDTFKRYTISEYELNEDKEVYLKLEN